MERRVEPRFQVSAGGKVASIGTLENQSNCNILEISATGVRLLTEEKFAEQDIISVEFEDHVLIARVMNVQERGDKYAIGAARIHYFSSEELGTEKQKLDALRKLLTQEKQPEPAALPVQNPSQKQPLMVAKAPVETPRAVPATSSKTLRILLPIAASLILALVLGFQFLRVHSQASVKEAQTAAAPVPPPEPVVPKQEQPSSPAATPTPEPVRETAIPAATPVRTPVATPVATPVSAPVAITGGVHHVEIKMLEPSWIAASTDGKALLGKGKMFAKDAPLEFEFSRVAFVHVGNSKGIRLTMDGKVIDLPGEHRTLSLVKLTPSGFQLLPWTDGDPE